MSAGARILEDDWFPEPLPGNVQIGEGSYLHSAYAFINCRSTRPAAVRIGRSTGVYAETFFDLGLDGEVEIGDYCTIAGPTFCTNSRVRIGNYVMVSREVVIADHFVAAPQRQDNSRAPAGADDEIVIEDDCWLGTRSVLLSGARLGQGAIVGAGAVVDFEVPAYAIVAGNPATIVAWARPGAAPARA